MRRLRSESGSQVSAAFPRPVNSSYVPQYMRRCGSIITNLGCSEVARIDEIVISPLLAIVLVFVSSCTYNISSEIAENDQYITISTLHLTEWSKFKIFPE